MDGIETALIKIINNELLYGCLKPNFGLFNGKMGLSIFLYHCSQFLHNTLLSEFAGEILDEVLSNLHDKIDYSFYNGLSGIAWGIEYLAMNDYIELCGNEVFIDIDRKFMGINLDYIDDISLETGILGIKTYIDLHLKNGHNKEYGISKEYIDKLDFKSNGITYSIKDVWNCILNNSSYGKYSWQNGLSIIFENNDEVQ